MPSRIVNLSIAVAIFLLVVIAGGQLLDRHDGGDVTEPKITTPTTPTSVDSSNAAVRQGSSSSPIEARAPISVDIVDPGGSTRVFAVKTSELHGLPPNAPPGTSLQLWVAWDPPITKQPRFQLLLKRLSLEKIIAGVTPEAPASALLRIKEADVADLLYGDRYGSLSVTVIPEPN